MWLAALAASIVLIVAALTNSSGTCVDSAHAAASSCTGGSGGLLLAAVAALGLSLWMLGVEPGQFELLVVLERVLAMKGQGVMDDVVHRATVGVAHALSQGAAAERRAVGVRAELVQCHCS